MSTSEVYEQTTRWYNGTIQDRVGADLEGTDFTTFHITIYEKINKTIVRARVDVANGGLWDLGTTIVGGLLEIQLTSSDNRIVGTRSSEVHVILMEGVTTGTSETFVHIFEYTVKNLPLIPTP